MQFPAYLIVAIPMTLRACSSCSKQSMKNFPRANFEMERPGDLSWSVWNGAAGSSESFINNKFRVTGIVQITH